MTNPADCGIEPTEMENPPKYLSSLSAELPVVTDNIDIEKVDQFLRHALGAKPNSSNPPTSTDYESWLAAALPERFKVKERLGLGTFGIVFLVHDERLHRDVAVKVLRPEWMIEPTVRARFLQESRAAARLNHTHIVRVLEADENDRIAWQVRDVVHGDSLSDHLKHGPLSALTCARWISELAYAVGHAHQTCVLHRDIKPDNILIDTAVGKDLSQAHAYLTDFGLAKVMDEELGLSRSGSLVGTPRYMAPELFEVGSSSLQPSGDVYSLGAVLYECLTGTAPFENATSVLQRIKLGLESVPLASDKIPTLSKDIVTICSKAMSPDASARYASATDMADDLSCFLQGLPIKARPMPYAEQLLILVRQNRGLFGLSVALLASLLIIAGVAVFSSLWISKQKSQLQGANQELISQRERAEDLADTSDRLREQAGKQQELYRQLAWNSGIREAYRSREIGKLWEVRRVLNELQDTHPAAKEQLEWRLLKLELHDKLVILLDRPESFSEVRTVPGTSMVIVSSESGHVYLLETKTAAILKEYPFEVPIHALAIHPSLPIMAVGGSTDPESDLAYPAIVNFQNGEVIKRLDGLPTTLESLQFSADGRYLMCAARYQSPRIYDWNASQYRDVVGNRRNEWVGWLDQTKQFVYQANRDDLAVVAAELDSENYPLHQIQPNPTGYLLAGASIEGSSLVAVYDAGSNNVKVIRGSDSHEQFTAPTSEGARITCMVSGVDGRLLAAGSERGEVCIWQLPAHFAFNNAPDQIKASESTQPLVLIMRVQVADSAIRAVTFAEEKLICCTESGLVLSLDLSREVRELSESEDVASHELQGVWETAWARVNGKMILANVGGSVYSLERSQLAPQPVDTLCHIEPTASCASVAQPPTTLKPATDGISVKQLSAFCSAWNCLNSKSRPISNLRGVAVSSGAELAAWPISASQFGLSHKGEVELINAPPTNLNYEPTLSIVSASEEHRMIVVQGEFYFLRVLSADAPYAVIQEFELPGNSICAQWHSDGERIIVGGNFDSIVECNIKSGTVKKLRKVVSSTNALSILKDADCLLSAHDDGSIRLSGIGNSINDRLSVHDHPIRAMVNTSDERLGISVDDTGEVALWTTQPMQSLGSLFNANHAGDSNIKVYTNLWLSPDDRELCLIGNSPSGPEIRTWSLVENPHLP